MKSLLFAFLMAAGLTFASCEKCYECEILGVTTEYCDKDDTLTDAFCDSCEIGGGTCTEK